MKIYIIGIVGTGKTYLANKLSNELNIKNYELDSIVYNKNIKNDNAIIENKFNNIIKNDNWIIEDVLRPQFQKALELCDKIIFMDINIYKRNYRLIKRYIKRKFKLDKTPYENNLKNLKQLLKWSNEYEKDKVNRLKLIENYQNKTITIHNNKDIKNLIITLKKEI